jgi:hypothetical protein
MLGAILQKGPAIDVPRLPRWWCAFANDEGFCAPADLDLAP